MRVFLDTNVLASAFGTRGLCGDVLRLILAEHELIVGEVVAAKLQRVLKKKFGVPAPIVKEVDDFLRGYHVDPRPHDSAEVKLSDRSDRLVVISALNARADILITGDREMLALARRTHGLRIMNPREFFALAAGRGKTR